MSAAPDQPAKPDKLGLGSTKKLNIIAWSLAAFVVILGVIMLVVTGKKVFIIFIILGLLTGLNVIIYDNFVLKPKVARLRAQAKEEDA